MNKPWLWIVLGVLILALGAELIYFFWWPNKEETATTVTPVVVANTPDTSVKSINMISDSGVTWVPIEKLADLNIILATQNNSTLNSPVYLVNDYYKIADLADGGELIMAKVSYEGPGLPIILRFSKSADGVFTYLVNASSEKDSNVYSKFLAKNVKVDTTSTFKSLTAPTELTVKGETLKISTNNNGLFTDLSDPKPIEIAQTSYGKIYQAKSNSIDKGVGSVFFALKLADSSFIGYTIKFPFMTDNMVPQITWSDGTVNTDKFTPEGYIACGTTASNNIVLDTAGVSDRLFESGKTSTGDPIYIAPATDIITQTAYDNYKNGRTKDVLTLDQFSNRNAVFVWQSKIGVYVIFTNSNFGGMAECGKPVIYLYPQKKISVSVKVSAAITASEPTYGDGWNVVAEPSGKLTVAGKVYDSLFWEGTGGYYPIINQGTVVETVQATDTIKSQLAQLGLNQKEIADFVEFWVPKMPNTPYVRLTWFGTSIMDKLAPLTITPKPDSVIRVFLDFQGLNKKINIEPQILTALARHGFSVVEWGGLLR